MVSGCHDIDAAAQELLHRSRRDAVAAGQVLAVGDHHVGLALSAQVGKDRSDGLAPRPPHDIGDEEDPHEVRRSSLTQHGGPQSRRSMLTGKVDRPRFTHHDDFDLSGIL